MGTRGPAPKRTEQRRRRNTTDTPVERPEGAISAPPLDLPDAHPLAVALYEAIAESPEANYFTPAVWQRARISAHTLSQLLYSGRPSSQMYAALQSDWKDFLISPADQRRLGIEVQRAAQEDPNQTRAVSRIEDYKRRLSS